MFRAALVSIVLTLATGQDVSTLCRIFCDPVQAATTGCHDDNTGMAAIVKGNDDCGTTVDTAATLAREEQSRAASDQHARPVVVVPRALAQAAIDVARAGLQPGGASGLESPTVLTPLRI